MLHQDTLLVVVVDNAGVSVLISEEFTRCITLILSSLNIGATSSTTLNNRGKL